MQNQIALITGSSRGIGRAIALKLASLGAHIVVNYVLNESAADDTVKMLTDKGIKAFAFRANVGDPKAIDDLIQAAVGEFGTIDIVVHNAALGAFKPVHQLKINQWDLSMDVNTKAFLILAQKVAPLMEKQGRGSIVAVSSLGSKRYIPHYGAIGISKSALENLVRYLAVELSSKGIRINCVSGGLIDTEALKYFPRYEEFKKEVVRKTPAGRLGQPEDIAQVVGFLVMPDSGWIYGQTIIADGGLSLI